MAWVATESFETYADGNNIAGLNGGSGWAGAWAKVGGGNDWVIEATGALAGSLSAQHDPNNGTDTGIIRQLAATFTSGIWRMKMKREVVNGGLYGGLRTGTNSGWAASWNFNTSGDIILEATDVGNYSANVMYVVDFEYDASTDQMRIRLDGGTWSSWVNVTATAGATGVRLVSNDSVTAVNWLDDISDGNAAPAGNTNFLAFM